MKEVKSNLLSLKLSGMANCYQTLHETRKLDMLSFADGLQLLIQAEKDQRASNRYNRLVKQANFRYVALIDQVVTGAARGLDLHTVTSLSVGSYIKKGESVIVTGCTGVGKSFLATAFGFQACRQGYTVYYSNTKKLLTKLKAARLDGSLLKTLEKLARIDLLILDDFGLTPFDVSQQNDLMEVIEDRHGRRSTIISSQLPVSAWFDLFSNTAVADAILDRVAHASYRIELQGESMRKLKI